MGVGLEVQKNNVKHQFQTISFVSLALEEGIKLPKQDIYLSCKCVKFLKQNYT